MDLDTILIIRQTVTSGFIAMFLCPSLKHGNSWS
jgi:hypothetical protein